jgi:hypothetical protein
LHFNWMISRREATLADVGCGGVSPSIVGLYVALLRRSTPPRAVTVPHRLIVRGSTMDEPRGYDPSA